jgi:adenylyltransferase/sulfurtransferase
LVKTNTTPLSQLDFENKYNVIATSVLEISPKEALEQIENPDVLFLDVRNEEELPKISLPNNIQIPLADLEENLDQLDSNKKLLVYCQSGVRSKRAVEILRNYSFLKVQSIAGGALKLEGVIANNTISIKKIITTDSQIIII